MNTIYIIVACTKQGITLHPGYEFYSDKDRAENMVKMLNDGETTEMNWKVETRYHNKKM